MIKAIGIFFLLSIACLNPPQAAVGGSTCPHIVESRGSVQVHMIQLREGTVCYVSVHNRKAEYQTYRDYLFTSDGELMIFNSLGYGPDSSATGAREFFMFPRVFENPSFEWNDQARRLIVTTVSGNKAYFDYEDAEIIEMTGARVERASEIRSDNNGGVEIKNYQGLLLDGGFKLGAAPTGVANAFSQLTDKRGKVCRLQNKELFKYPGDGDVIFKFSDAGLRTFLKGRCPQLVL